MGHDNITKLGSLLVKLHRGPSSWLCLHPRPERNTNGGRIKLVRSDGSLEVYDRPVVVSELTKDFPKHEICRSDLLYIGQKTPVLSETETLKLGLNYFLLPSDFFKNDLSFLTIATLKTSQNGGVMVKKTQKQPQPFLIQKGEKGERLRIRVSEDFISELMMEGRKNRAIKEEEEEEEEEEEGEGRVCTTVKLKKDYVQLVGLRKWKPKLETITETKAMKAAAVEKTKKKRKRFSVMKKKSSHQSDSCSKRKLQSKFKSKSAKKTILRKVE
ncbi:PREDICTED: uncharacterized protein LOC104776869 [Camelina sativa]|uniref:Uncharacterized protein LOC104776869 n=1 Tax=Camelina sativa TaxID=90675 RepID=A0ABM0YDF9_CAMSA|nr:PREDICTED: uncharacterized protein LOC104776869 [Camelina sativa]